MRRLLLAVIVSVAASLFVIASSAATGETLYCAIHPVHPEKSIVKAKAYEGEIVAPDYVIQDYMRLSLGDACPAEQPARPSFILLNGQSSPPALPASGPLVFTGTIYMAGTSNLPPAGTWAGVSIYSGPGCLSANYLGWGDSVISNEGTFSASVGDATFYWSPSPGNYSARAGAGIGAPTNCINFTLN